MSSDYGQGPRRPRIVVRETDGYVEHPEDEPPASPPSRWIRDLFQPIVVVILIACVAHSVAALIALVAPLERTTFYWVTPVVMALIGFHTQRVLQAKILSRSDHLRLRVVELGLLFLVVKAVTHFDNTLPELLAHAARWTRDPSSFFDTTTVIAYALGAAAWWAAATTARDLDAMEDPVAYLGETEPSTRLVNRYAYGGAALLVFTALTRVRLSDLVQLEHQRVRNPIVMVLAYFFLGLTLLGQLQYARLSGLWQRQRVNVAQNIGVRWLRYTLLFIALAALVAFALPTGYTVGFLDLIATLIYVVSVLALLLYTLILWPLLMLLALLTGREPAAERPAPPEAPFSLPPTLARGGGGAFWDILQSILFWAVLLASLIFLTRSYLRDHPDLFSNLQRHLSWQRLRSAWQALIRWMSAWGRVVTEAVPLTMKRLFGARKGARREAAEAMRKLRQRSLREQVRRTYLDTLEEAERHGVARHREETPYEYHRRLAAHLAEDGQALADLTEIFVVARYSIRDITPEDVTAQRANAQQVQRALAREDAGKT